MVGVLYEINPINDDLGRGVYGNLQLTMVEIDIYIGIWILKFLMCENLDFKE